MLKQFCVVAQKTPPHVTEILRLNYVRIYSLFTILGGYRKTSICCVALILRHCSVLHKYASFLRISCALHLNIFQQPPYKWVFRQSPRCGILDKNMKLEIPDVAGYELRVSRACSLEGVPRRKVSFKLEYCQKSYLLKNYMQA